MLATNTACPCAHSHSTPAARSANRKPSSTNTAAPGGSSCTMSRMLAPTHTRATSGGTATRGPRVSSTDRTSHAPGVSAMWQNSAVVLPAHIGPTNTVASADIAEYRIWTRGCARGPAGGWPRRRPPRASPAPAGAGAGAAGPAHLGAGGRRGGRGGGGSGAARRGRPVRGGGRGRDGRAVQLGQRGRVCGPGGRGRVPALHRRRRGTYAGVHRPPVPINRRVHHKIFIPRTAARTPRARPGRQTRARGG